MGLIVGKPLSEKDSVIIVDDVITAGTAVRETIDILEKQGNPRISAVIVSVDRMEKGTSEKNQQSRRYLNPQGLLFTPL